MVAAAVVVRRCERCASETKHRFMKDSRGAKVGYYQCAPCLEQAAVRHRKRKWEKYLATKANARKRPGSEILTDEMIKDLNRQQDGRCALSGVAFDIEHKWNRPSLDRIDSSQGYTRNNIRLVTWIVNHCRGALSDEMFLEMCGQVAGNKGGSCGS